MAQETIEITAARNKVAAFPLKNNVDITIGDKYNIYRFKNNKQIQIGIVEIAKIINGRVGVRLIEEYKSDHIEKGDILIKIESVSDDDLLNEMDNKKKNNLESWYTYWGIGYSNTIYPNEIEKYLDFLKKYPGVSHVSISLDLLGFYWPRGDKTLIGAIINGWGDRYELNNENMQINGYLYSVSIMRFLNNIIGTGPFIRGDIGLSNLAFQSSGFKSESSDTGFGVLLGVGTGIPISRGTRILFNINYSIRSIKEYSYKTLNLSIGGLF
jgi:hypothetical protein